MKIAMKMNIKKIFGDSNLVLFYWSQGRANREGLNPDTVKLIDTVSKIRKDFEKIGGVVSFVSGDINPADLGFHK
ncbi:MAG: ribonuclease HI, partial [Fusobacteriaceae bacterium]